MSITPKIIIHPKICTKRGFLWPYTYIILDIIYYIPIKNNNNLTIGRHSDIIFNNTRICIGPFKFGVTKIMVGIMFVLPSRTSSFSSHETWKSLYTIFIYIISIICVLCRCI